MLISDDATDRAEGHEDRHKDPDDSGESARMDIGWEGASDKTENRANHHDMSGGEAGLTGTVWAGGHTNEAGKNFITKDVN